MFDYYSFWDGNDFDGFLLVFSNVALVPVIVYLALCRDVVTPVLLINTIIASSCYHACRAGFFCETLYDFHVTWDYISVYIPITWMITYLGIHNPQLHIFAFFLSLLITIPFVLSSFNRAFLPLVGIGVPIVISFNHAMLRKHRMFYNWPFAIATFILAITAGAFMFAFPHSDYGWAHSLWHLFSMLSAFTFAIAISEIVEVDTDVQIILWLKRIKTKLIREKEIEVVEHIDKIRRHLEKKSHKNKR
jgi:hypothetical protein